MDTTSDGELRIRLGDAGDSAWAASLMPEFARFGLPPWRDRDEFVERCRLDICGALEGDDPRDVVYVAMAADGNPCGFVHLRLLPDPNGGVDAAHICDLLVAPPHQGQGIGGALIEFAELWARDRDASSMVLAVFQDNTGARRLYERHGFRDDIVRVVRQLG